MKDMNTDQANDKTITVSWTKLVDGIGLVFAGATQMLSALEPQKAQEFLERTMGMPAAEGSVDAKCDVTAEPNAQAEDNIAEADNAQEAGSGTAAEEQPADTPAEAAETQTETRPAPSVTQDDITKIIVRKIKQDRANSGKISAILKTYGYERVSDLPPDRYERFLTDISQL